MSLSADDRRSNEDFAVRAGQRPDVLLARGRLTAAAGELLYDAITTSCEQAGNRLVVDLTAVTGVELAGWAWLLPAMQECRAAGCQLRIEPPSGELRIEPPSGELRIEPTLPSGQTSADPATLRCYPDGPILVRGNFELVGRDCQQLPRNRSVLALCRCGGSAIKPFCDGTHKTTRFTDG